MNTVPDKNGITVFDDDILKSVNGGCGVSGDGNGADGDDQVKTDPTYFPPAPSPEPIKPKQILTH